MERAVMTLVVLPEKEWNTIKETQAQILTVLQGLSQFSIVDPNYSGYITAKEFMHAVRIKRTKFDQLVQTSKVKIIKKDRKIYVPVIEVERHFANPSN